MNQLTFLILTALLLTPPTALFAAGSGFVPDTPSTVPDYFCTSNVQGFVCTVIHRVGLMDAKPGDISDPGLVLAVEGLTKFPPKPPMKPGIYQPQTK